MIPCGPSNHVADVLRIRLILPSGSVVNRAGFDLSKGLAAKGYGAHSLGGYSLLAALITEVVMTMMFLPVILGATVLAFLGGPDHRRYAWCCDLSLYRK